MARDWIGDGEKLEADNERDRRSPPWLIGLLVIATSVSVIGLLAVIVWLPPHLIDARGLTPTERLKAENDLRGTLAAVLGGLAVLGGSVIAGLNLRHNRQVLLETARQNRETARQNRETLQETERQNRESLEVARRGQVTERFTKAIEQLGQLEREKLAVRLGGIYALEQIALDSEELHWPIMEVLTGFLRENSRGFSSPGPAEGVIGQGKDVERLPLPLGADLQAIATVLGRRPERRRRQEIKAGQWLDLRDVNLPEVDLIDAKLENADLRYAQLKEAHIIAAELQNANLEAANLEKADLSAAELQGAKFILTVLRSAYLTGAQLQNAVLRGADLLKADLTGADLTGADLSGATGLTRKQLQDAVFDDTTRLPPHLITSPAETDPDAR